MSGKILRTKLNLLLTIVRGSPHKSQCPASPLPLQTWAGFRRNSPKIHITVQTQRFSGWLTPLGNKPAEMVQTVQGKDFEI